MRTKAILGELDVNSDAMKKVVVWFQELVSRKIMHIWCNEFMKWRRRKREEGHVFVGRAYELKLSMKPQYGGEHSVLF